MDDLAHVVATDGEQVAPHLVQRALTAGPLVYEKGATQVFSSDGATSYFEGSRVSVGEWRVDDNARFWSFWPPDYTAEYELFWIVEDGRIVGVKFVGRDGETFMGRYRHAA